MHFCAGVSLLTCVVLFLCAVCVMFAQQGLALLSAVASAVALTQGELREMEETSEKAQHMQQHRGRHPAIPLVFLILQLEACSCMLIIMLMSSLAHVVPLLLSHASRTIHLCPPPGLNSVNSTILQRRCTAGHSHRAWEDMCRRKRASSSGTLTRKRRRQWLGLPNTSATTQPSTMGRLM